MCGMAARKRFPVYRWMCLDVLVAGPNWDGLWWQDTPIIARVVVRAEVGPFGSNFARSLQFVSSVQ